MTNGAFVLNGARAMRNRSKSSIIIEEAIWPTSVLRRCIPEII